VTGVTRITVLTPPGSGAIATIEVRGPRAWETAVSLFKPAGQPMPQTPRLHRFWFGTLGGDVGDEVILAVTATEPETRVEIHCHGGRRAVEWVADLFRKKGCVREETSTEGSDPSQLLAQAPTVRTASILLDQVNGAFRNAVTGVLELLPKDPVAANQAFGKLSRYGPVGRHLIDPWKVIIAGPPNVGKSSLINALAGFQRAIVSEVAGTTRDVVTVPAAFDGWPVELTDTAGLREAEGLEADGIDRARQAVNRADLILWVLDATREELMLPDAVTLAAECPVLLVLNQSDRAVANAPNRPAEAIAVSALTGAGISVLAAAISSRLVPASPRPGEAVPYTHQLADLIERAEQELTNDRPDAAIHLLRACLPAS
jgi:tRNA modification GTPase